MMDLKKLLNQVLQSSGSLVQQGKGVVEKGLNIPASGSERDAMVSGLGKGALAGGALSLLLGTKTGRKMGEKAAAVGGVAALGTLAYKAYQGWQEKNSAETSPAEQNQPVLTHAEEQKSTLILQAMIAAAKADGHVDDAEKQQINEVVQAMGASENLSQFVQAELDKPLDPAEIARSVGTPEEAAEVYLASLIVVDEKNFMEKAYLNELASQLNLEDGLIAELEAQVSKKTQ